MRLMAAAAIGFVCVAACFGDVRFMANTDHTNVTPGEQVQITVDLVVNKSLKGISPPPVAPNDAFTVANVQQNQSSNTSIEIINGRVKNNSEIHYVFYYVIVPKKAGAFIFPALQVTIDNTPYATEPIAFNASGAEPAAKNADLRVTLDLGKPTLYVGDQSILTFKVAQRANSQLQVESGWNGAVEALEKSFGKDFALSRLFTNQVSQGAERIGGECTAPSLCAGR